MLTRTESFTLLLPILAAPILAGCLGSTIVGGAEGEGGGGGAASEWPPVTNVATGPSVAVGTGSGAGSATTTALAAFGVELEGLGGGSLCDSVSCPDDMLFLLVDSDGNSCDQPYGVPNGATNNWSVQIGIPPLHQQVGTYTLDETFLSGASSNMVSEDSGGAMVATGGVGGGGILEILAIDDATVRFRIAGMSSGLSTDGEYVASRCGVATLPPEGIALAGDRISVVAEPGDPEPDPDALTVVVGTALATCEGTLATTCTGEDWQIAVVLPPDYLTPGVYSLSDPRIRSTNCAALPKFLGGTIEVLEVDEDSVMVQLADVVDHATELQQQLRLSRCL